MMITLLSIKTKCIKRKFSFLLKAVLLAATFLTVGCVEKYDPNLDVDPNLLNIDGSIIRGNETQTVVITRSTPINQTRYLPVTGCNVYASDESNNVFHFEEYSEGNYRAIIEESYLAVGAKFKLTVITPENVAYESDYEEIPDCPEIDSLYFIDEANYSNEHNGVVDGIKLYLSLPAIEGQSKYYRWKINETWEYRAAYKDIDRALIIIDDAFNNPTPDFIDFHDKDSLYYCWKHAKVEELFSSSTQNISNGGRKRIPFQFIDKYNQRMQTRYSCLVSQYSLNQGAYNYWQNKQNEIQESGGMYFTQPSQTTSNLKNIDNPEGVVLGYFWTSTLKQKRIFYEGQYKGSYYPLCSLDTFKVENYIVGTTLKMSRDSFPVFVIENIDNPKMKYVTADPSCIDCRLKGGTIERPDYW